MNILKSTATRRNLGLLRIVPVAFALGLSRPGSTPAQVPPRFYIDNLAGSNAVPVIFQSVGGNTNPLDPAHFVSADADIQAEVAVAGYARLFTLFDRSAMAAVLLPMGHISGETTVGGRSFDQSATGFGDPMLEFNINVVGPPAIKDIPDIVRYEPGFSLDIVTDLAFPVGEYDSDQALNLGQNRWYGRVGSPAILQIGSWAPGRRTTFELLPSLWLFSDNEDYVGSTLETAPLFQLEAHLTRDFLDMFWGSLDATWVLGGKSTIDGEAGSSLNSVGVGFTLGYGRDSRRHLPGGESERDRGRILIESRNRKGAHGNPPHDPSPCSRSMPSITACQPTTMEKRRTSMSMSSAWLSLTVVMYPIVSWTFSWIWYPRVNPTPTLFSELPASPSMVDLPPSIQVASREPQNMSRKSRVRCASSWKIGAVSRVDPT